MTNAGAHKRCTLGTAALTWLCAFALGAFAAGQIMPVGSLGSASALAATAANPGGATAPVGGGTPDTP
ncbi:MAG TPA: hypothetical protein VGI24_08925, partial [Solirubrobacteraceae bacterium]